MATSMQLDFPYQEPFGKQMSEAMTDLTDSISEEMALAYMEMHTARLIGFWISEINTNIFDMNEDLTKITHAPLGSIISDN